MKRRIELWPRWALTIASVLLCLTIKPAVALDAASVETIANYKGPDRTQMLIDDARNEGTVVFYSGYIIDEVTRPLVRAFQARYPFLQVQYFRSQPAALIQKLLAESRAGKFTADVAQGSTEVPLKQAGVLRPFYSPEAAGYPENRRQGEGYWVSTNLNYLGLSYNTNMVAPKDVPQSYEDLLDPKWTGKMAWSNDTNGAQLIITGIRSAMGEETAYGYLEKLAKQKIASVAASNRAVADSVIAGEYAIEIDSFLVHAVISAAMGAPIAPKPIDPVLTYSSSVMLVRDPPHPHAALLFIDFLLSKEGQGVLREAQMFPADPKVGASPKLDAVLPAKLGLRENFLPPEKMQGELKKSHEIFVKLFNP